MSLHVLDVVPRDVAAEQLGLLLDAPAPAALAELALGRGTDRLLLGVLGASHVVTARAGGRSCVEQVSCDASAGGGVPLPGTHVAGAYALRSRTRTLPAAALHALAGRLREAAQREPGWLCGAFPAPAGAVTALHGQAVPGGWAWRTWHLYPGTQQPGTQQPGTQQGAVVTTRTRWTP